MIKRVIKDAHKLEILPGDTIIHNGVDKTVSANDIKTSEFMGVTVFGDSYNAGYKMIKKVFFLRSTQ